MKPDIISKLDMELREEITSERQVVYIMVELRKLIELNGDGRQYAALKCHCDWIAHPVLTGSQARHIVELSDRYQQLTDRPSSGQAYPDRSVMGQLGPVLTMSNLRNELNTYLRTQGLDPSIPNDDHKWASFLRQYASVIEDCPLRCVSQSLTHVDEVVIRVVESLPPRAIGTPFQLAIEWSWKSKTSGDEYRSQHLY